METFWSSFWSHALGAFLLACAFGFLSMLIEWSKRKKQLGTIKCRRCQHEGPPEGFWVPFRGVKPVCQNCHSDDWLNVNDTDIRRGG
jgi:hypothetical protein